MKLLRITSLLATLAVVGSMLQASPAYGTAPEEHKVTICHATSSETNPYVRIVVDKHAIAGHFDNNGTTKSGHEDDILLQGERDCPAPHAPPTNTPPNNNGGNSSGGSSGSKPKPKPVAPFVGLKYQAPTNTPKALAKTLPVTGLNPLWLLSGLLPAAAFMYKRRGSK